jgi:uncharacterized protein YgbK (DUF1537 family)
VGQSDKGSGVSFVTKAGSFGTERAMIKANYKLQGNEYYEALSKSP